MSPDPIDRVAPTRRPDQTVVMYQRWSDLLFLHWTVDPDAVRALLPPGLTLDTFEGKAYVGLVPFTMQGVRPRFFPPMPGLSDFHETNVRTYVHYEGQNPGVWFFSLDAANAVAVKVARATFRLPYHYATMHLRREGDPPGQVVDYGTERHWPEPTPATCAVRYTVKGEVRHAEVGTLEHFLAERYILYSYKKGTLYRGRVHHVPYPLQTADVHALDENLVAAAGLTKHPGPPLVHYARGVSVDIFPLEKVR